MLKLFNQLLGKTEPTTRTLSVLQLEVTSRCQLKCRFCPNQVLGDDWQPGDFPWELYRDKVAPHFSAVDWVYLQGWGEPLLHPHLWDMFRLAKKQAQRVGFTSNGILLTERNARRLIEEGADLLDVSFSGNTAQTHEAMRCGSRLAHLKRNVRRLADLKAQLSANGPVIVLSYMLTRPGIKELPEFIDTAAEIGANEVVAINLDYTPYPLQDELRVFTCEDEPPPEYEALLQEAARRANKAGLVFRRYPLAMEQRTLVCDARPLDTVFINYQGDVTPCTYLGLAVQGQIPRLFCSQPHPVEPVSYGNVSEGLLEVWQSDKARTFKEHFARRDALSSPAMAFLNMADNDREPDIPPPPPQCVHCHKLYKL